MIGRPLSCVNPLVVYEAAITESRDGNESKKHERSALAHTSGCAHSSSLGLKSVALRPNASSTASTSAWIVAPAPYSRTASIAMACFAGMRGRRASSDKVCCSLRASADAR